MPELDDKLARALADYDNLRKQINQRVNAARRAGEDRAINHLLEPLDNLQRAFSQFEEITGRGTKQKMMEALQLVQRSFDAVLAQLDVERIDALGQPYDAQTMLAIGQQPANGVPDGHVAGQVRPAYKRSGRLLREAQVVVATKKNSEP